MPDSTVMRRGTVLEPLVAARTEERLCVLLNDATAPRIRLCIARRDAAGRIQLTEQEFTLGRDALDALRPVSGEMVDV
ncbi:MAG TPA: hypothetical protein VGM37_03450 [Armatimonadota bacterium]|jgi:hypothetical protein